MLLSLLNVCTKEELEVEGEGPVYAEVAVGETAERMSVIKNKTLDTGRFLCVLLP